MILVRVEQRKGFSKEAAEFGERFKSSLGMLNATKVVWMFLSSRRIAWHPEVRGAFRRTANPIRSAPESELLDKKGARVNESSSELRFIFRPKKTVQLEAEQHLEGRAPVV